MEKNKQLLSIGEASKITGVHVKSLRYYDRIGVFKPEYVDERSGYRYYSFEQLQNIIAVRTCLDNGIVLNEFGNYSTADSLDYLRLIRDARDNIEKRIAILEKRKMYLDFMTAEVSFNDELESDGKRGECYGSIALWTMPFEGDIDDFSRKDLFIKMAEDAQKKGYQVNPFYFGMLMKCSGEDRKIYVIAGVEDFLTAGNDDCKNIYHTPKAWYKRVERPDLDVTTAEQVFPELFEMDYDKTVLTTISLHSSTEPKYSMFINLPEQKVDL